MNDFESNPLKVIWTNGKGKAKELSRLKWLYTADLIDSDAIREERREFCRDNNWNYEFPEDNYGGDIGAIVWWNDKIIAELKEDTRYSSDWTEATWPQKEEFYQSLDWDYIKYLVWCIEKGTCQSCHIATDKPEYDHLHPIFPITHRMFYRNFWIETVQTLCKSCHQSKHANNKREGNYFIYKTTWP